MFIISSKSGVPLNSALWFNNMSETKVFDNTKAFREAKEISAEIKLNLPKVYDIASISTTSKLPFKALSIREVIIHRVSELSESACYLFEAKKHVSAFIIIRSLMETVAILYWLNDRIKKVNKTKHIGNIDHFFMRLFFGCRDDEKLPDPYNVLKAIDKINENFNGFRKMYDDLSEFAHPNWAGLAGSYSELDKKNFKVSFGSRTEDIPLSFGLAPLTASLHIFKHYYNESGDLMPEFITICESELDTK